MGPNGHERTAHAREPPQEDRGLPQEGRPASSSPGPAVSSPGRSSATSTTRDSPASGPSTRSPSTNGTSEHPASRASASTSATRRTAVKACEGAAEVYNLAADMGGMGFIERYRVECLRERPHQHPHDRGRLEGRAPTATSSPPRPASTTPTSRRTPHVRALKESDAYPAMAERGYGWEKLFSEMFCQEYWAERGLKTAIARFHNVYGPYGTWDGGREKAPAALCRKVIEAKDNGSAHDRDLGRRHADPELHVHRRLRQGHRHDHALRRAHRHADQPGLERAGLDQRAPGASSRRSPGSSSSAATTSTRRKGVGGRNSDNTMIRQRPGLGAVDAAPRRAWPGPTPGSRSSTTCRKAGKRVVE